VGLDVSTKEIYLLTLEALRDNWIVARTPQDFNCDGQPIPDSVKPPKRPKRPATASAKPVKPPKCPKLPASANPPAGAVSPEEIPWDDSEWIRWPDSEEDHASAPTSRALMSR
jgi:hypothetical protein